MTALRPEREGSPYTDEEAYPYGDTASFESAVDQLADPLNDPLPGRGTSSWPGEAQEPGGQSASSGPDWPGSGRYEAEQAGLDPGPYPYGAGAQDTGHPNAVPPGPDPLGTDPLGSDPLGSDPLRAEPYGAGGAGAYGDAGGYGTEPSAYQDSRSGYDAGQTAHEPAYSEAPYEPHAAAPAYIPLPDDETVGLRTADLRGLTEAGTGAATDTASGTDAASDGGPGEDDGDPGTDPGAVASASVASAAAAAAAPVLPGGGRAARRRAAKRGGGRHAGARPEAQGAAGDEGTDGESGTPAAPLTRLEARRAARALKPGPGVIASRAIGEVFITIGVLMLLFVTYQLWWTNVRAHQQASGAAHHLQDDWANGKDENKPGVFAPGQGFAIMHIPTLDVVVPIAQGIDKHKVLDRGMVGHYDSESIDTPMPDAKTGNFAVAGHRNTHGEPFRYINRLKPGDPIVVETRDKYFVYDMTSILPQTPPSNTSVLKPVPPGSGFTKPGRYITLTTCTPEFTSTYRMIVWGKLVEERPRSEGKPDALTG